MGEAAGEGHDLLLGFPLELMPEENPYATAGRTELGVRLLYEGKPCAGALVTAHRQELEDPHGAHGHASLHDHPVEHEREDPRKHSREDVHDHPDEHGVDASHHLVVQGLTDAEGRVRFKLERPGFWMLSAVHMVPAPEGVRAEWESFWASLTFELGSAAERGRSR